MHRRSYVAQRLFLVGASFLVFLGFLIVLWFLIAATHGEPDLVAFVYLGIFAEHAIRFAGVMRATNPFYLPQDWEFSTCKRVLEVAVIIECCAAIALMIFLFDGTHPRTRYQAPEGVIALVMACYLLSRGFVFFAVGRFMDNLLKETGKRSWLGRVSGTTALAVALPLAVMILSIAFSGVSAGFMVLMGVLFIIGLALHLWMFGVVVWGGLRLKRLAVFGGGAN